MREHPYSPFEDFFSEARWYQKRKLIPRMHKEEMRKIWKESPVVLLQPNNFDAFRNFSPYRGVLVGKPEERISKLVKIATTENRDDVFDTRWEIKRKKDPRKYILKLAELIWNQDGYDPVNVVDVNGKEQFITGGRTRAAIGKALEVPVLTRIICIER
jgi:hypothetical protein